MRLFRDEVIVKNKAGRELVDALYAEHCGELSKVLVRRPRLARSGAAMVMGILPVIENVLDGKDASVSQAQLAAANKFLRDLAAASSPGMRAYISRVQRLLRGDLSSFGIKAEKAKRKR